MSAAARTQSCLSCIVLSSSRPAVQSSPPPSPTPTPQHRTARHETCQVIATADAEPTEAASSAHIAVDMEFGHTGVLNEGELGGLRDGAGHPGTAADACLQMASTLTWSG